MATGTRALGIVGRVAAAAVLAMHGLIHLLGFAVYWRLAEVEGISYRTNLLSGDLPVGEIGAWAFGLMWLVGAVAFLAVGFSLLLARPWWRTLALGTTLFSLAVTVLGLPDSPYGVAVNLAILAYLLVVRSMSRLLPGASPPRRTEGSGSASSAREMPGRSA